MGLTIEKDFTLMNKKKGGGAKKKKGGERKNRGKGKESCYSKKHVRAKEALMLKREQNK